MIKLPSSKSLISSFLTISATAIALFFILAMGDGDIPSKAPPHKSHRFIDNKDGTVTDSTTGLIWLKNANCFGKRSWTKAMADAQKIIKGSCGLSDMSSEGEWRLPTKEELLGLIHSKYHNPALSNDAGTGKWKEGPGSSFTNVQSDYYWTSTSGDKSKAGNACYIGLAYGDIRYGYKTFLGYVWPVKSKKKVPKVP